MTTENQGWRQDTAIELVPFPDGALVVDSVALAPRGGSPTYDQWAHGVERLRKVHGAVKYWIGDLINMGETLFSEEASQIIDQSFLTEQEVKQYSFVAKNVAPTTRAHAQTWDHSKAVAWIKDAEKQEEWLDKSRADDWSARKLSSEIASAAAADGKTVMRFWLVVECGTEAKRDKLAESLEGQGYGVKRQEKLAKVAKPKRAKKESVTAQRKRKGAPKRNQRKRPSEVGA